MRDRMTLEELYKICEGIVSPKDRVRIVDMYSSTSLRRGCALKRQYELITNVARPRSRGCIKGIINVDQPDEKVRAEVRRLMNKVRKLQAEYDEVARIRKETRERCERGDNELKKDWIRTLRRLKGEAEDKPLPEHKRFNFFSDTILLQCRFPRSEFPRFTLPEDKEERAKMLIEMDELITKYLNGKSNNQTG